MPFSPDPQPDAPRHPDEEWHAAVPKVPEQLAAASGQRRTSSDPPVATVTPATAVIVTPSAVLRSAIDVLLK